MTTVTTTPTINTDIKIVEVDITVPSSLRTLTEADYGINGRTAIPKKLGTKEGIHIHDPQAFTPFESMRNSVRNKLMEVGVKPTKSNIFYIPADKWGEVEGELDNLEKQWEQAINTFVSEYDNRRAKFHENPKFLGWEKVLQRKVVDVKDFVPRFHFEWVKSYDAFDSNEELEAKMDKLGDKLLNEVVSMADKIMNTSITKRGDAGMTTKIRFPLIGIRHKLNSWVSIRPEVGQAIKDLDEVISKIPTPKENNGMTIAVGSEIYNSVADLVTRFTTVDGIMGSVTADDIKNQQAHDMVDALNQALEAQGDETVSLPDVKEAEEASETASEEQPEVDDVTMETESDSEPNMSEAMETSTVGSVEPGKAEAEPVEVEQEFTTTLEELLNQPTMPDDVELDEEETRNEEAAYAADEAFAESLESEDYHQTAIF